MRRVPKRDLPRIYKEQLFANEVMLLPYYIAALNIEHAYYELTGKYEPFEGLCFVDSLDLAEAKQAGFEFMTEKNTERVQREKKAKITVIIGNPPYNAGQQNENDNNKNRKYKIVDRRVRDTYARDSTATNKRALGDPYVKFFRWATDRLAGRDGLLCFVSNNSFVIKRALDGVRFHLQRDFSELYHLNLNGDVRENPRISGTSHNVFGIQLGVGTTLAVSRSGSRTTHLNYHEIPDHLRREDKLACLHDSRSVSGVRWDQLPLSPDNRWCLPTDESPYEVFLRIGRSDVKASQAANPEGAIFQLYGPGVQTNRDHWVYDFRGDVLEERVKQLIETYNGEVDRYHRAETVDDLDSFLNSDERKIKWSSRLKETLLQNKYAVWDISKIRHSRWRPFTGKSLFFDTVLNHRPGIFPDVLPNPASENEIVCCTNHRQMPFHVQVTGQLPNEAVGGRAGTCFPFYTYKENGTHRRENITDWALEKFRAYYSDPSITKWDIFYYVYGVLHHPGYREKFADNLKRELPRVPFAPDFRAFADAGRELARLHLDYEKLDPYPLKFIETSDLPLSYRVEDKMRLNKTKTELKVNPSLTLRGIPEKCFEYRLGNRSALDWVINQYRVTEHKRSGIKSDPNRLDDPEYIVRLVGQVIYVSLETVRIVGNLPEKYC